MNEQDYAKLYSFLVFAFGIKGEQSCLSRSIDLQASGLHDKRCQSVLNL